MYCFGVFNKVGSHNWMVHFYSMNECIDCKGRSLGNVFYDHFTFGVLRIMLLLSKFTCSFLLEHKPCLFPQNQENGLAC